MFMFSREKNKLEGNNIIAENDDKIHNKTGDQEFAIKKLTFAYSPNRSNGRGHLR